MYFRIVFLLFLIHALLFKSLYAQNNPPIISNMKVVADTDGRQLIITYDLKDTEDSKIKIMVKASDKNSNKFTSVAAATLKGDIGLLVSPGKSKKIYWTYPTAIKNIEDFKIKLIADDMYKIKAEEIINKVSSQSLSREISNIYGVRSHDKEKHLVQLYKVRKHIENRFVENNLTTLKQSATLKGVNIVNLIGELEGVYDETSCFILCAHYDTDSKSPGADDNGSGVVGMLEAMKILSGYSFKKTIRFIGFDGEEIGHLGSRVYVKEAKTDASRQIKGLLNFDMIGYYSNQPNSQKVPFGYDQIYPEATKTIVENKFRGDFILNTANNTSVSLGNAFKSASAKYVPGLKVISLVAVGDWKFTPELNASDHIQFWKKGYNALQIGDTGPFRNSRLDTRRDVLKTLNFTFMSDVVKATVATLVELAEIQHCTTMTVAVSASK